jgi:uncharacterized Zn-binding protein involved in type VI secretion
MPAAARLGDKAQVDADAHGCPACPHPGVGPIVTGSPDVTVNGKPAARQDDLGVHAVCCGPNTFTIKRGSPTVYVNGKPFARMNDTTKHCGGSGPIIDGSPDVYIDDGGGAAQGFASSALNALQIALQTQAQPAAAQKRSKTDTHPGGAAGQAATVATSQPLQGYVKSGRWSVQRARKGKEVSLFIECSGNLTGSLNVEIWVMDADGTLDKKVHSLQENAAPQVKAKWKVDVPPNAAERNEVEFCFLIKTAQGEVRSDTLFVEQPRFRAQFVDSKGAPLAGWKYELTLPDGTVLRGETDGQGRIREDAGTQAGTCTLVFVDR